MASQQDRSVDRPTMPGSKTVVSYSEKIECEIHWKIPNFSSLKAQTTPLYSHSFVVGTSVWRIKLVPLQIKQEHIHDAQVVQTRNIDATGLYLVRDSSDVTPGELGVEFNISVKNDSTAKSPNRFEYENLYGHSSAFTEETNCYGGHVFEHTAIWGKTPTLVLDGDRLNVRATVCYFPPKTVAKTRKEEVPLDMGPLHKRFRTMFDSQLLKDFILVSSEKNERPAHRALLAASSPVFSAMLQSGMVECRTGRYVMPDVSTDTLEAMLRFLYYKDMTHLKKTARTVLVAADKYQVEDLKEACEQILVEEISDDTAAGLLLLGDKVNGRTLKDAALRHVAVNLPKMTSAGQTTEIVNEGGKELVGDILEAVVRWGYKQT